MKISVKTGFYKFSNEKKSKNKNSSLSKKTGKHIRCTDKQTVLAILEDIKKVD